MNTKSSKTIAVNILKCLAVFYSVYYSVGSVVFACFRQSEFDGKIQFNFLTWIVISHCCKEYGEKELVNVVSMEVTYFVCGAIFGCVVQSRIWDYAITVTVFHVILSSIVMLDFPVAWSWWVCLGCGLAVMISIGEAVGFACRRRSLVQVNPEPNTESFSYLVKKK